ncbi:glycosyl transferase [Bacteroides caecigallinarum]|uniref:glycosyltransferase family 32 protein n=1 Tax=Bacteroides caecigallinarum TaxID=1411144 RepID=UPI00195CFE89|nr:glycosyltransferase [Bacteroides caecigallinarum]MBM6866531.1 glycosyl transferase [Bacteroides caecigallinarum]
MIPKIIHYCWLSGDLIPEKLEKCMKSWKEKLPDYEFILWDKNRFNINSILWTKQAYEAKKYAFAADYIRLYAVYTYGGIYLDMDVEVLKSFNNLLERKYILGFEGKEGIEAGIFGAEKNADWVKSCLDYYNGKSFITKSGAYDIRPLPSIMYEIISKRYKDLNLLPFDFLTAKSYKTGKITVTENTVTIHHFAGSWVSKKDRMMEKVYGFVEKNKFLFWIYNNTYKRIKKN